MLGGRPMIYSLSSPTARAWHVNGWLLIALNARLLLSACTYVGLPAGFAVVLRWLDKGWVVGRLCWVHRRPSRGGRGGGARLVDPQLAHVRLVVAGGHLMVLLQQALVCAARPVRVERGAGVVVVLLFARETLGGARRGPRDGARAHGPAALTLCRVQPRLGRAARRARNVRHHARRRGGLRLYTCLDQAYQQLGVFRHERR